MDYICGEADELKAFQNSPCENREPAPVVAVGALGISVGVPRAEELCMIDQAELQAVELAAHHSHAYGFVPVRQSQASRVLEPGENRGVDVLGQRQKDTNIRTRSHQGAGELFSDLGEVGAAHQALEFGSCEGDLHGAAEG